MHFLLALLCLVALAQGADPVKTYPIVRDGIQFINMAKPALSKLSNLVYDPGMTPPALWFTADKSNPNIFLTRFDDTKAAPFDWWFEGGNTFQPLTSPPFLSIDVNAGLIAGCALPSAANNADAYDAALQATQYSGVKNQSGSDPFNYPGYSFYSIIRSKNKAPNGNWLAYVTGWAEDGVSHQTGFFIARIQIGTGPTPDVVFEETKNVLVNVTTRNCYDLFTTVKKPLMWLDEDKEDPNDDTFLFVALPGRCSEIIRVILPDATVDFKTAAKPDTFIPTTNDQFLASAARDPISNQLYVAVSSYNRVAPTQLISILLYTTPMQKSTDPVIALDTGGIDQVNIAISADSPYNKSLFVTASGAAQVYKYNIGTGGLSLYGIATLPPAYVDIGSLLVRGPWLYFTTYVSDGVVGRLHVNNSFCKTYCGSIGYCNNGACACQTPYVLTLDESGNLICINPIVYEYITKEVANQAAATAFGVLFAFSLVAALAGWYMWWREKNVQGYQTL